MDQAEVVKQGRNFRLLASQDLPELLDFLAAYLPESLKFHQTLLTFLRNKVWTFYFYVANDWPSIPLCLHFPGMTLTPHNRLFESFGLFCPNDKLCHLRLLRDEDILIDWTKPLYINFVHSKISEVLTKLYHGHGSIDQVLGDVWACDKPEETEQLADFDGDVDVQVLPLKAEHAENIHDLYPANDMECHELFLRLIKHLSAAGVFADGVLTAWMVQSYYGAMFSMQTIPEFRRKGYGTKLARFLTKQIAENGYQPFVVIRPENEASQSLYKKLNFRRLYQMVRMTFIPNDCKDDKNKLGDCSSVARAHFVNNVNTSSINISPVHSKAVLNERVQVERKLSDPCLMLMRSPRTSIVLDVDANPLAMHRDDEDLDDSSAFSKVEQVQLEPIDELPERTNMSDDCEELRTNLDSY